MFVISQKSQICTNGWEDWGRKSSKHFTGPDVSTVSWYLRRGNHPDFMRTHLLSEMSQGLWPFPPGPWSHDMSALQGDHQVICEPCWWFHHQCDGQQTCRQLPRHMWGAVNAVLDMRSKCTACKLQKDAVSFCCTCNNYICDKCLECHQNLKVFEGHEIVSTQDVINGKVIIDQVSVKVLHPHTREQKYVLWGL